MVTTTWKPQDFVTGTTHFQPPSNTLRSVLCRVHTMFTRAHIQSYQFTQGHAHCRSPAFNSYKDSKNTRYPLAPSLREPHETGTQ